MSSKTKVGVSTSNSKFKVGDKIKIGDFCTYVRDVYPNPIDKAYNVIKYKNASGRIDFEWENECEIHEN